MRRGKFFKIMVYYFSERRVTVVMEYESLSPDMTRELARRLSQRMIVGDVLLASEGYRNGEPDIVGLDGYQLQWLRHAFRI